MRVVSLVPAGTEMVAALGAEGVLDLCDGLRRWSPAGAHRLAGLTAPRPTPL